jgi:hypothetical protein
MGATSSTNEKTSGSCSAERRRIWARTSGGRRRRRTRWTPVPPLQPVAAERQAPQQRAPQVQNAQARGAAEREPLQSVRCSQPRQRCRTRERCNHNLRARPDPHRRQPPAQPWPARELRRLQRMAALGPTDVAAASSRSHSGGPVRPCRSWPRFVLDGACDDARAPPSARDAETRQALE